MSAPLLLLAALSQSIPVAIADSTLTCGAIKTAFRRQFCCGNPNKEFLLPEHGEAAPASPAAPPSCGRRNTSRSSACAASSEDDFRLPSWNRTEVSETTGLPPLPHWQFHFGLIGSLVPPIGEFETPIQQRIVYIVDQLLWNCVAAFHPSNLAWTHGAASFARPVVSSPDPSSHTTDARQMCGLYAVAALFPSLCPGAAAAETFLRGLPASVLGLGTPDLGLPADVVACGADAACLRAYAECHGHTPRAVGEALAQEADAAMRADGWNADGSTACSRHCRPYADTTGYDPYAVSLNASSGCNTPHAGNCWRPLLEDNGKGYFMRQEFVVPHIGTMASPALHTPSEIAAKTAPKPLYDYSLEVPLLVDRLSKLNATSKAEVRFFDSKLSVVVALFASLFLEYGAAEIGGHMTYEQIVWFSLGYTASEYDATLTVWKEKVRHNLIRPTTVIQDRFPAQDFVVWDGISSKGKDFQPYLRAMPHAEYPSGLACLCQGIEDYAKDAMRFLFSSTVLTLRHNGLEYRSLADLNVRCGESRLNGGLHFRASVDSSHALCAGIGTRGFAKVRTLLDTNDGQAHAALGSNSVACAE